MIQPVTLLGACLCLGVLWLRYRSQPKDRPRRSREQILKTAKVVLAAVVAWMALSYSLQHMIFNLDGAAAPEPSLMERIVLYLSK
jgi:peptidoglycan biosynthesis protein MviN/MurJ (putative lipid II flippase)